MESDFFMKTCFWAAGQKWKSMGLRLGSCAGKGYSILLLMTRRWNLSTTNFRAVFMQCDRVPSYIHHKEERLAVWRNRDHTTSLTKVRYESQLTDEKLPSSSMNAWTIGILPLTMATIITFRSYLLCVSQMLWGFLSLYTPSFIR